MNLEVGVVDKEVEVERQVVVLVVEAREEEVNRTGGGIREVAEDGVDLEATEVSEV